MKKQGSFPAGCRIIYLSFLCLVLPLATIAQAVFEPGSAPADIFPLPTIPTAGGVPTGTGPTGSFYDTHEGGSCYNYTFDFDSDGNLDEVYVWSLGFVDISRYDNAVAYKVVEKGTGTVKYRGTHYVGGDITTLQVGMVRYNTSVSLVVAYWTPGEIRLAHFQMTVTGLNLVSDMLVDNISTGPGAQTQHLSLDCHDLDAFTIAWEDPGLGIRMKGYRVAGTGWYSPLPVTVAAGPNLRLPDIAMSHKSDTTLPVNDTFVHLAFVDITGANPVIYKYTVNFDLLMSGGFGVTMNDALTLGVPFGVRFDEFQLKIDAPDHYNTTNCSWSYVYYNNDANKINLRLYNQSAATTTSYIVNDGSLPGSSGDITSAGNAFPSVTYHPDGDKVYVAWFTTYDPSGLPATNIYTYQSFSQRYIAVVVDDAGNQLNFRYQNLDANYASNWPGFPKICLSKHNESDKVFTVFSGSGPTDIWPYGGGIPFLGKYYENSSITAPTPTPTSLLPAGLSYSSVWDIPYAGTSAYIAHRITDWYSGGSPFYKQLQAESKLIVGPNPFSPTQLFQLKGDSELEKYQARLVALDGRSLALYSGTIKQINEQIGSSQEVLLAPGLYLLQIQGTSGGTSQQFRLQKQD